MRPLSSLREGWDEIEAEETRRLRQMTVQETVAEYLALQREFEPQLQATEEFFREERLQHLAELQRRLRRLDEWKRHAASD